LDLGIRKGSLKNLLKRPNYPKIRTIPSSGCAMVFHSSLSKSWNTGAADIQGPKTKIKHPKLKEINGLLRLFVCSNRLAVMNLNRSGRINLEYDVMNL